MAPKDAKLAREIFIREALVNEDFDSQAPFWQHNKSLIKDIRDMEHKSRRPDVLVDDEQIFAFYDSRLGAEVCSVSTLEKWRKENEAKEPKLLFLSKKDLMRHDASGITIEYFPKKIEAAGIPMAVSYNFDPGSPRDGVTLTGSSLRSEPNQRRADGMAGAGNGQRKNGCSFKRASAKTAPSLCSDS